MQPNQTMLAAIAVLGLVGGVVGESFHPRLRAQNLRAHFGALSVDQEVQPEAAASALIETNREMMMMESIDNASSHLPLIESWEGTLATLEADKRAGKVTPGMDNFVKTVTGMIHKEMIPAIMKQDKEARVMLHRFEMGFDACGKIRSVAKAPIASMALTKSSSSKTHMSCRKVENVRYVKKEACLKIVAQKKSTMDTACGAFKAFKKDPSDEANTCHTTNVPEPYGLWLTRNRKYFQKRLIEYRRLKGLCDQARRAWNAVDVPCSRKVRSYDRKLKSCIYKQHSMEMATCTYAKKMKDTCVTYETCYDAQKAMYMKMKPKLMVQEKDRKGEFRALKRIECLLTSVFGGDSVKTKEIDVCKNKTHSTKHLDLVYPVIPDKKDCEKLPPIPGEKLFKKVEFSKLPKSCKPDQVFECVLDPAGGVIMGLEKRARKDKCRMDNGWLVAQSGGSCLLSGIDGLPVSVDYTKRRFTKYRFSMKMDETNARNGQSEGGGFSICNLVGQSSIANGKDPTIYFDDTKAPSRWGYHLSGGWGKVVRKGSPATCKDLLVTYKVWGRTARGIDVAKYTQEKLKWIGCMGDGCSASSFYCNDQSDGIVFGSPGTLRGLLGSLSGKKKATVPQSYSGCCSGSKPHSICNAMDKTRDINALCRQLGYTRGTILSARKTNYCPEVGFGKQGWGSDFVQSHGYGNKFRCQGAMAKNLYTNKKYYKDATPKAGIAKQWDLTMEYKGGKYFVRSLKIEGKSFSGYRGSLTKCPAVDKKGFKFSPRISAQRLGKVYIKDFRVFQGNRLKKMKQVVGQGLGKHAELQKKLLMKAALAAAAKMAKCSVTGLRNGNAWRTRNMIVSKDQTRFWKNTRVRRGWNSWALLNNVVSFKFTITQRNNQHIRIGLTYYKKPHLHYPAGAVFGIYTNRRLLVQGWRYKSWRKWSYGDEIKVAIEGRNYCMYQNNKKIACRRTAPKSGKARLQIWMHDAAKGRVAKGDIKAKEICVQQR